MSLSSILLLKNSDTLPNMSEFNSIFGSNQLLKRELVKFITSGDVRYTSENGILEYINFGAMDIRTNKIFIKEIQKISFFFDKYFFINTYRKIPKTAYFIETSDTGRELLVDIQVVSYEVSKC